MSKSITKFSFLEHIKNNASSIERSNPNIFGFKNPSILKNNNNAKRTASNPGGLKRSDTSTSVKFKVKTLDFKKLKTRKKVEFLNASKDIDQLTKNKLLVHRNDFELYSKNWRSDSVPIYNLKRGYLIKSTLKEALDSKDRKRDDFVKSLGLCKKGSKDDGFRNAVSIDMLFGSNLRSVYQSLGSANMLSSI